MARDLIKIKKLTDDIRAAVERGKTPEFTDKRTIAKYESMPNHNVIERAFDKDKRKEYNAKQQLLDSYTKAKERETQRFIEKNNISDSTIKNAFGNFSKEDAQYLSSLPGADMDYLREYHDRLQDNERAEKVKDFTEEHPVLSNIASPFVNAFGSMGKTGETIGSWATGTPLSNNTPASDVLEVSRNIKGATKGLIDENVPENFRGLANTAYDVGSGVLDFGTALALGGGNPTVAGGIMASNAAGNSFYDTTEKGVNPNQVMATGLTNAGAEYLMNLLPLGVFDDALKSGGKNVVKNIAKQGMAEAVEEGTTEVVNTVADAVINKDKSDFALVKQQYLRSGMSEEEATKQAIKDTAKNVGYSALVGGLSGSAIGGGTTMYNNYRNGGNVDGNTTVSNYTKKEGKSLPNVHAPGVTSMTETTLPSNNSVTNSGENVNAETEKQYNTKSVDGFDDVSKEMNKLIGMYGNDSIKTMHSQVMSLVNEYIATNDMSKMHEAMDIASEIDRQLLGKTYKYKATRKGTKGENARAVATYTPDSYIDTLYSEIKDYETMAGLNAPKMNTSGSVPYLENANNNYADTTKIEGENQRVRSYNETLIEKTDAPQTLKNEFIDNPDVYTQLSNQKTLDTAMEILNNNDIDTAINEYHKLLDAKNPVAVPLGYNISKHLAKNGKLDESVQIVREMSEALTKSGQFSQAAAITMLNNNPEAAKRYLVRQIDFLNREGKEKFGKKWNEFELTKEELQMFNDIADGDAEAIKNLYNDVFTRVRKEYPSTFTEKLMEYRRVAMLLNVRTNVRNVVSNAFMLPVRWTADRVAALGEGVYSLIKPEYSRTQSLTTSKESKQLASKAFENVKSELLIDNKYEDRKDAVRDKQVFKGTALSKSIDNVFNGAITKANQAMGKDVDPSLMETARNFTYYLLQKGDDVFVKKNFESRMASYLEAQGITSLEDIPADAYMLATQEALKATFKDDTALANGLSHFRQMLNKAPGGMLGDIVMPFTKTPANLAMRGIDYSPIGVYNGIKTLKNAKDNADVSKGITQLAQSATGTMAIALGMALAEAGLISGALSEDKDEAQFQRQQGMLPYAIKTPYGYFSYDWAQPASIPLILGVTIHDSFVNGKDFVNGMKQGSLAAVDSWLELSPLQNMSEIFGGYGTPAENVAEVLFNDFPLSFVPSQLNAVAKVGDRTQRVSYSPDSKDSFLNQAMAKVPFLSNDLPVAYDTWGNPIERQDNVGEAIFANMLNPGQFGNENATQIDDDIMALYDATGNASVFPKKAAWSYKVGGENIKLDNKQYSEFQRIAGNNAYSMADSLINSDYYTSLSDEQKAEVIANMYSFADALAKSEVLGYDVADSDTYKKSYAVYKEKGVDGVALFTSIKTVADGATSNAAHINAVNQFDVSDEEKGYYITKLKGKLSQEAQEVFQTEGYAGVYKHYYTKALAEKVKETRKYSEMGITSDMVDKVKKMRNDSPKAYVTQEMIDKVKAMRSK